MPLKSWLTALAVWAIIAALVMFFQISTEIKRQERDFQRTSESLYELITQRLDQNETVLGGLEALFNTFGTLQFDDIRGYSRAMLKRYPHIYVIELQPRVDLADVTRFEKYAASKIRHQFYIKDFNSADGHDWQLVPPRPFYYPITFMEPVVDKAEPLLGLDVYADPKFHNAIEQAVITGKAAASAPFNLFEGGRGYLIFKAIFDTDQLPNDRQSRFRHATQLVSMLIHTDRFLSREELPAPNISMTLYHRGFQSQDANGMIDRVALNDQPQGMPFLFPDFLFTKWLPSESQPFVFETRRQLGWDILRAVPTFFSLGGTLTIVLLAAAFLNQRRGNYLLLQKNASVLYREKEKALVTLNSIADAVITLDSSGLIEYLNPAVETAIQRKLGDLKGKHIDDVLLLQGELSQTAVMNPFSLCLDQKRTVDLNDHCVLLTADGKRLLIEGSVAPLFNSDGEVIGAVVAFRDMGPIRKRALETIEAGEKKLRQRQAELAHVARLNTMGEMASGIAHEINQPLTAILSYNQACIRLLHDEDADLEEIMRIMRSAAAQSRRAGEIIKRLRAFVTKQAGQPGPIDLNQTAQNVLTLSEHELRDHRVRIRTQFAMSLPAVIADGIQLEQVILNLVRNGIDSMADTAAENKVIAIATWVENGRVSISVRDFGHGISARAKEQLFNPFFTTKSNGMGLGLTISQSIIDACGGTLIFRNRPMGGAEFSFSLPAAPAFGTPIASTKASHA